MRLVIAAIATLLTGLVWTAAFAAATIGQLNLVSLSFGILFIGLGIDFGLHLGMRYWQLLHGGSSHADAMRETASGVGGSLVLCTFTTAVGFFVFNISAGQSFEVVSSAVIKLSGDIVPEEVLFNVLGDVGGGGIDDASISGNSLFRGTLLAPERNVLVMQNHFYTFSSGDLLDDDGGTGAPSTTAVSWQTATEGLFGQIVSGGKITWSESDISHHAFMTMPPVPEPISFVVWSLLGLTCAIPRRRRA